MEGLRDLVIRAQSGTSEAFARIVRRFQDMAYGYAYSMLGDFHLAEDVAQQSFIEAYCRLGQLREPAAFPGWFRRIVRSQCGRLTRRSRVPTAPVNAASGLASGEPGPEESAERSELSEAVLAAVAALPEAERTVTTLFYIDGCSQEHIARFLEVPVTTVNGRLRTSRKRLKERMTTMARGTFAKHALPRDFTRRVVTLAKIVDAGAGKRFEFQFANGVTVRTRIDRVIRDERHVHLLVCGLTEIGYHSAEPYPRAFDSFLLVPSALVTVKETGTPRGREGRSARTPPYGIRGAKEPKFEDKAEYAPLAVAAGPLELAPRDEFGFIHLGGTRRPTEYRDLTGTKHVRRTAPGDVYVHESLIRAHHLKQGDVVKCTWRPAVGNERFRSAVEVLGVREVRRRFRRMSP